jgi:hypothetical protein
MKFKKMIIATLVATSSLGIQGCTDSEVGLSVGAIVGGVIGNQLGKSSERDRRYDNHYNNGYDQRYDGRYYRHPQRPPRYCDRYRCYAPMSKEVELQTDAADSLDFSDSSNASESSLAFDKSRLDNPVLLVSEKYQIPEKSAQLIVSALIKAQNKDYTELNELGIDTDDFELIYKNENPSYKALMTLSQKLGLDAGETNDLIQNMKADIQAERQRLNL